MARTLKNVDAHAAAKLKDKGALMVDVRESGEYARSRIPGTKNIALSRLEATDLPLAPDQAVVFFCASGNRTNVNAVRLAEKAGTADAYVMQGGLFAWDAAGLPVESGSTTPGDTAGRGGGFFSRVLQK